MVETDTTPTGANITASQVGGVLGLLHTVYVWRSLVASVVIAVSVLSAAIALILPKVYKARAVIMLPPEEETGVVGLLRGLPWEGLSAGGISLDRVITLLSSETMRRHVVRRMDLVTHYESDDTIGAAATLDEKVRFLVTREGAIRIDAEDGDSLMAAKLANVVIEVVDFTEDSLRLAGTASEPIRLPDGGTPGVPSGPPPEIPQPRAQAEVAPATRPAPDTWSYIALGDSLTAGNGATAPSRNFPTRLHQYLNQTYGVPLRFQNLGISGEDSSEFQTGEEPQLDRAIQIIEGLKNDGDPNTRVHLITITMGANDIFPALQGAICFANPNSAECQALLDQAIALYETQMQQAMSRLVAAVEPGTVILYASYYNPFNFGTGLIFETVSQQTVDKVNEAVSRVAVAHGATVAPVGPLFGDLAFGITHIGAGDIHPNDEGHGVATRAFQDAYEAVTLPG